MADSDLEASVKKIIRSVIYFLKEDMKVICGKADFFIRSTKFLNAKAVLGKNIENL